MTRRQQRDLPEQQAVMVTVMERCRNQLSTEGTSLFQALVDEAFDTAMPGAQAEAEGEESALAGAQPEAGEQQEQPPVKREEQAPRQVKRAGPAKQAQQDDQQAEEDREAEREQTQEIFRQAIKEELESQHLQVCLSHVTQHRHPRKCQPGVLVAAHLHMMCRLPCRSKGRWQAFAGRKNA